MDDAQTVLQAKAESRQVRRAVARGFRRKLFDGKTTAEEVHRRAVFGDRKCSGCRVATPSTIIRVFFPLDELIKRDGAGVGRALMENPEHFKSCCLDFIGADGFSREPFVRVSTAYACPDCLPAAERAAAKLPSWAHVEINRGPGADKVVVGWDGEAEPPLVVVP